MNCHISDLHFAKERILKDLKENKNRRLSALFRDIRKTGSADGIGDWPIMSMILQIVSKFKNIKDTELGTMCKQSPEFREMNGREKRRLKRSLIESVNY